MEKPSFKSDKKNALRLLGLLKPYKKQFLLALATSLPASSLNGAFAYFSGPFLDQTLKRQDYNLLLLGPAFILGAVLVQAIFLYTTQYLMAKITAQMNRDLQRRLCYKLTDMDIQYFKSSSVGELFTRYYGDPYTLNKVVVQQAQSAIIQIPTLIVLTGVLLYRNWMLAMLSLVVISLIAIPMRIVTIKLRRLNYTDREITAGLMNRINENLYGNKVIQLFMLQDFQRQRFDKALKDSFDVAMSVNKAAILLKPINQVISAVGVSAIFFLSALQVKRGQMSPGEMTSFVIALVLMYKPFKSATGLVGKTEKIMAPAERVFALLDKKSRLQEPENPVRLTGFTGIEVKDVHFAYGHFGPQPLNQQRPALNGVSLSVRPKQVIALVGANGSGKTTMADMLVRLMDPDQGHILMNGVDLRDASLASIRANVAYVAQDNILFEGTIRENIRLGCLNVADDEIGDAVRLAQLSDWIDTLPEGLDTQVGERGALLSGGQRQRIAIARAFVRKAPLIILDEATSALDNESEALVQKALKTLMVDKTVIIIAHRLSNVVDADRIFVFSDGRIVESGTHADLMRRKGDYYRLYITPLQAGLDSDDKPPELQEAMPSGA